MIDQVYYSIDKEPGICARYIAQALKAHFPGFNEYSRQAGQSQNVYCFWSDPGLDREKIARDITERANEAILKMLRGIL